MKTEEQKKDLEWFDNGGSDFDTKHRNNHIYSETKPVWMQWEEISVNGEVECKTGIGKFGLITDMDTEETEEAITIFDGFDEEYGVTNDYPYWDELSVEYQNLEWCELSELNKL